MVEGILKQQLERVREFLRPLVQECQREEIHWVRNSDEGFNWCCACAEKEVEKLLAQDPDGGYQVDGGYGGGEEDSPAFCDGCGAPLSYTLTDYGAEQELDHFYEHGFLNTEGGIGRGTAYELDAMLDTLTYQKDPERIRMTNVVIMNLVSHIRSVEDAGKPGAAFGL